MNGVKGIAILFLVCLLGGCTTYGVRDSVWQAMTPEQQQGAMKEYAEEQRADEKIQHERAEAARLREQRLLASLQADVDGKVLQGKLVGGRIRSGDEYYEYEPVTFKVKDGGIRKISIQLANGRCRTCYVEYVDGIFWFDAPAHDLDYNDSIKFRETAAWTEGIGISDFDTDSGSALRGRNLNLLLRVTD